MVQYGRYAFDVAKEITVAIVKDLDIRVDSESGAKVGDFFQSVYEKVVEIAKNVPDT